VKVELISELSELENWERVKNITKIVLIGVNLCLKECYLKKQSQFVPGQNGATSCLKGDYDNIPAGDSDENKAKQSRLRTIASTEGAKQTSEV
jgi:hypothetical protein